MFTADINEQSRALLKSKADEYLNRAEAIRPRIDVDAHEQRGTGLAIDVQRNSNKQSHTTAQSVVLDVSVSVRLRQTRLTCTTDSFRKRSNVRHRQSTQTLRRTMQRRTNST